MATTVEDSRSPLTRRILKWVGVGVLCVAAVAVVVLVLLVLAPVRRQILRLALPRAFEYVPGRLTVSSADWPRLGSLHFTGVSWHDDTVAVFSADTLSATVRVWPLLRRDVKAEHIVAHGVFVDVPALRALVAPGDTTAPVQREDTGGRGFPRGGSVPGVPSVAVDSISVTVSRLILGPGSEMADLVLTAGFDFGFGSDPGAHIDRLTLRGAGEGWRVDDLNLTINLGRGIASGRGSGAISPDFPIFLSIDSPAPDEVTVMMVRERGSAPPEGQGLLATLGLTRDGLEISSIAYDIVARTPGTQDLARIPALAAQIYRIPPTKGITLMASGTATFKPEVVIDAYCELREPDWPSRVMATVRYETGNVFLDTLSATLADLSVEASGRLAPDSLVAWATIGFSGSTGIRLLAPGIGVPDSIDGRITASVALDRETELADARVGARGRIGGFTLDDLALTADVALPKGGISAMHLRACTQGLVFSTAAEIERAEDIIVRMEPITVRTLPCEDRPAHRKVEKTGTVTYSPGTKEVTIDAVEAVGALGEIRLDGHLDRRQSGRFRLQCQWPEPPAFLCAALLKSPGLCDALRAAWDVDAPFGLDATGTLSATGGQMELAAAVSFRLPGPRTWAPLLPGGADVAALGPVLGHVDLHRITGHTLSSFDLVLGLNETEWIDTSAVHISGRGDSIAVDTVLICADELKVALRGGVDLDRKAGWGRLSLADAGFLRHFSPSIPDIDLVVGGTYSGATARPEMDVAMTGALKGNGYHIPSFTGTLTRNPMGTAASIQMPEGVAASNLRLQTVRVDYATSDPNDFFPASIVIAARGEGFTFHQGSKIELNDRIVCTVDSMRFALDGKGLESVAPFRVEADRISKAVAIEQMDLAGELGRIYFNGIAAAESVNIEGSIALVLPSSPPPSVNLPPALWPDRLDIRIRASGKNDLDFEGTVTGFILHDGSSAVLRLEAAGRADRLTSKLTVNDGSADVLDGTLSLPVVSTIYPLSFEFAEDDISLSLKLSGFPVALRKGGDELVEQLKIIAHVDGEVAVWGPASRPSAYLDMALSFPDWPEMSDFRLVAEAALSQDSACVTETAALTGDLERRVAGSLGLDKTESIAGVIVVSKRERPILEGSLTYPMSFSLNPFNVGAASDGRLGAVVRSEALSLEEIEPLLPAAVGLGGTCAIELSASGPVQEPSVSGSVKARNVRIEIAETARILLEGGVRAGGTARKPSITGAFTIENGIIIIPQVPKDLHPIEGEAILVDTEWRRGVDKGAPGAATRDSLRTARSTRPAFEPTYDIRLDIPSGFWLRGEGLEIEFRGDLRVVEEEGLPVITGDLNAQRGSLLFLGRIFDLERGTITFYGTQELNPSLDISLTSSIEQTKIWINLSGTLEKPELKLVSVPEMTEGDIMAMILFGKPLDELNDGQDNMLRDRSREILLAMGAAKLQQRLAGQAGIDLVSIRSARESNEKSALVVGKYITPRLLVMYEQGLGEKSTSYIVMEYLLHRNLKFETLYNNQEKTGAGLSLETEY